LDLAAPDAPVRMFQAAQREGRPAEALANVETLSIHGAGHEEATRQGGLDGGPPGKRPGRQLDAKVRVELVDYECLFQSVADHLVAGDA
jgi:hypothetical protein